MKFLKPLALLLFLLFLTASERNASSVHFSLQEQWDKESITSTILNHDSRLIEGKHVVFVAGIMNELAGIIDCYFKNNIHSVENELGGTTSYLNPSSSDSIYENADYIYDKINTIYKRQKSPLILVGHSKGGAALLNMILRHPELILSNKVEKILLIQASIGGSPLVEGCGWLVRITTALLSPNFETLLPANALQTLDEAYEHYEEKLKKIANQQHTEIKNLRNIVSSRIYYFRSTKNNGDISFGLKVVLGFLRNSLDNYCSAHDVMVPLYAQFDERIGTIAGDVNADHIDLTVSDVSNESDSRQRAFTRVMFKQTMR